MDEPLFTIGEVARRTGLSVKTIRFYADSGLVPPADRSGAGYRLYDSGALARLAFVRTLRDLGIDLATIRDIQRNVAGETHIRRIAAAHADALDVQIRTLRLRRAVLRAVADRGATPEEMETMHRLARLSEDERRRIIRDFLDEVFGGLQVDPGFEARMRSATPELPDEPTPEQVDAWIELAELVADDDFRRRIRAMAEHASHERDGSVERPDPETFRRTAALVAERGGAALAAGIDPGQQRRGPHWTRSRPRSRRHRERRTRPRSEPHSPSASRAAQTRAPSATGSCWPSSTAGRRCRRRCPRGSGRWRGCGRSFRLVRRWVRASEGDLRGVSDCCPAFFPLEPIRRPRGKKPGSHTDFFPRALLEEVEWVVMGG